MVNPTWSWLLTRWSLEPSVVIGIAALTVLYLWITGYRLPIAGTGGDQRSSCASRTQVAWYAVSVLVLVVALLSPLDYVGDEYLFSAHMIQHLILASVWPPIFLLSLPEGAVLRLFQTRIVRAILGFLTAPAVAFVIFNGDIMVWHLTPLYDLTLQNEGVHIFEHLTFMGTGLLVWWPVLSPIRSRRLSVGMRELYLFANLFPMMGLGIFFTFWQHALYGPYISAPRLWGMSALTDQQIGGLIMWMPGDIPFAVAMLAALMTWIDRGDTVQGRRVVARPVESG